MATRSPLALVNGLPAELPAGDKIPLAATPNIVGEVRMYGGSSAPTGWALCDGSALSRSTYASLFGVIGTGYGAGDGSTTFNVPDLRGRAPVGVGTGDASDATAWAIGDKKGTEKHTLIAGEIPDLGLTATTTIHVVTAPAAKVATPVGNIATVGTVSGAGTPVNAYAAPGDGTPNTMATGAATTTVTQPAGGAAATITQPSLAINFIIALV